MAKIKIGNVRTPIDYLKQYFAPTGYGLGSFGVGSSDLDTNTKSGCYSFTTGCKNTPFAFGVVLVLNRYETDIVQIAFDVTMTSGSELGSIARRVYVEGKWNEWEYLNPPMLLGVEYRTTERWKGKSVYIKSVNLGNLPDTANSMGTTWVDGSFYGSGVKSVIACGGCLYKGDEWAGALPYVSAGIRVDVVANSTTVGVIASDGSFSDRTATVWVKYTKK